VVYTRGARGAEFKTKKSSAYLAELNGNGHTPHTVPTRVCGMSLSFFPIKQTKRKTKTQGDIKRFLCFFWAVCFPVFWRRRPDASKKQDSPSDAKAGPCGAFASHPAGFD
jgi:hypothetical protein